METISLVRLSPFVCRASRGAHEAAGANEITGFGVQGSGFRVQGSGFRVQGLGFRV